MAFNPLGSLLNRVFRNELNRMLEELYSSVFLFNDGTRFITSKHLDDGSVTNSKIQNGAVSGSKIADGSVTNGKLGTRSITWDKLDEGAVTGSRIADNTVGTSHIKDDAVTSSRIAENAVGKRALLNGSVDNAKIEDGAVSNEKLSDGSVSETKIVDNAVKGKHIAIRSIGRDHIEVAAVNSSRIADYSIRQEHINANVITNSMLKDNIVDHTKTSLDTLTINKGKLFPMVDLNRDEQPILLNAVLDVKVQNAEMGMSYSLGYIGKKTTSWGDPITFFQINKSNDEFRTDNTIIIGRGQTERQNLGNNNNGIKTHIIYAVKNQEIKEIFTITLDWDEIPIGNNNFQTTYVANYMIRPSQYSFNKPPKQSDDSSDDSLGGKLAFNINGRDIQFKEELSGTKNIVYTFGSLSPNDFFEITNVSTQDKNTPLNDFSGDTLLRSSTDWVSPYGMLVDNNPLSDGKFTVGGGHGTEGGRGFASGEFIGLYDIKVDGNAKANGNHLGNELTFRIEHFVSASNAIDLTTGEKRNTAKETRYYTINKDGIHVEVRIEALEDITLTHYAGIQTIQRDTFDKFYMRGDIPEKLYPVTGLTEWTFPTLEDPQILDRVIMYNTDIVMVMKTDRTYGIGTGEHMPESTDKTIHRPIYATPNTGKIYMHNLGRSGNNYKMSTGEDIRYKGQWTFTENKSQTENIVQYVFNGDSFTDNVSGHEVI